MPCWPKYCAGNVAVGKALLQTAADKRLVNLLLISKCK